MKMQINVTFKQLCKVIGKKAFQKLNPDNFELLKKSFYIVEATQNEIGTLYESYNKRGFPSREISSYSTSIGQIADKQVWISLTYYQIRGKVVCFYEMSGNYAFGAICDEFFKKIVPKTQKTNATNFHNVWIDLRSGE